jgi:DUF1365 family protein
VLTSGYRTEATNKRLSKEGAARNSFHLHGRAIDGYIEGVPMRDLAACAAQGLGVNRGAPVSFFDADHGDGRGPERGGATAWLDALLQSHGVHDATGPLWLHTYPRVLGYTFKPVSFWYCHRPDGTLRAIVAEVNNTFGERHCYLLDNPVYGRELNADKRFHVSPFCEVEGRYRFRFMHAARQDQHRTVVRIDYNDDIDLAEKIMRDHAEADKRVLKDPAVSTHVDQLGDSAVVITLWYWTAASDFWPTSREMIKKVKKSFDENGISIPFPQVTYHGSPQMVALPERFVDARAKEA